MVVQIGFIVLVPLSMFCDSSNKHVVMVKGACEGLLTELIISDPAHVPGKFWIAAVLLHLNVLSGCIFYCWDQSLNTTLALLDAKVLKLMLQKLRKLARRTCGSHKPALRRMKSHMVFSPQQALHNFTQVPLLNPT